MVPRFIDEAWFINSYPNAVKIGWIVVVVVVFIELQWRKLFLVFVQHFKYIAKSLLIYYLLLRAMTLVLNLSCFSSATMLTNRFYPMFISNVSNFVS